jgi:predicted secreted hydrolase
MSAGRLRAALVGILAVTFALRSACLQSLAATRDFTIASAPYQFVFPRDHGAHNDYQTEWWYFTGHLRSPSGRTFGYELTFFRFGLLPGDPKPLSGQSHWRRNQAYAVHFAITDEADRHFFYKVRFAREALGLGGATSGTLSVHVDVWSLRGVGSNASRQRMALHANDGENALDLTLVPLKPPAIHGIGGVSRKAACVSCASHYYSYTRIATRGSLTYRGLRSEVSGISWMDHEFGSRELSADEAGWDWFSLQLDDGTELMLYLLRRRDGSVTPQSSGSFVDRAGRVTHLRLQDFAVDIRGGTHWHSPHTGASYPSLWDVSVPSEGLAVSLTPTVADQELALPQASLAYWEGAVDVRDHDGKRVGSGYVELTGYAAPISQ